MSIIKELLLVLALAVAATSVQSARDEDYPEVELPGVVVPSDGLRDRVRYADPCCFPDKWQANITGQVGLSGGRDGGKARVIRNFAFFVDQPGKQMAGKSDEGGRFRNKSGGFVLKFKADKADLYFFSVSDQKCKHVELKNATFKPQCIPANATKKDIILGPATGGLALQAWSFCGRSPEDRRGVKVFVSGTIFVTDKCLPVAFQDRGMIRRGRPHFDDNNDVLLMDQSEDDLDRRGRGGTKFIMNEMYKSVKDSIDDTTVFDPPTYCNATLPAMSRESLLYDDDYDSFADLLERYVSF